MIAQRQRALPQTQLRANTMTGVMRSGSIMRPSLPARSARVYTAAYRSPARTSAVNTVRSVSYTARNSSFVGKTSRSTASAGGCGVRFGFLDEESRVKEGRFPPGSFQIADLNWLEFPEMAFQPAEEAQLQVAVSCLGTSFRTASNNKFQYSDPWTRNFRTKESARQALTGPQGVAANRFFGNARGEGKSRNFTIKTTLSGDKELSHFDPARNIGYGKRYVQVIDSGGNVIKHYKDTIGPTGHVVMRKWIKGGPK